MRTNDELNPVEVFAGTQWEASLVKSLLENAEIEAFLKDQMIGTLNPWHAAPGGVNPVKVFVSLRDLERATIVVEEYRRNMDES